MKWDVITRSLVAATLTAAIAAGRVSADEPDAGGADEPRAYAPPKSAPSERPGLTPIAIPPGATSVLVVPIEETVELGLAAFLKRAIADHPDAAAVVLDVDTFGGRVDAAVTMRDVLLELKIPTVAYVHPRAISAGALISLACERLVMSEGASIGAATPYASGGSGQPEVDEKMTSYMRTEMRATAEARGRPGDVAEAMVDADVAIDDVIIAGKLLTLDTARAVELGVADGTARTLDELLETLGLQRLNVIRESENWGEKIARFLTEPTVSGLLLSVGMLALAMTFYTQTFGALTLVGVIALGLFFGGHTAVELVGMEEVLVLAAGLALLAVELFVIPGFGVAGIAGLGLILTSLVMSLLAVPLEVSLDTGLIVSAIGRVAFSVVFAAAMAVVAARYLPRSPAGRRLVLGASVAADREAASEGAGTLVGREGEAVTDLRPAGKVRIAEALHDARSQRAFIATGARVRVIRVEGHELVVREEGAS